MAEAPRHGEFKVQRVRAYNAEEWAARFGATS
eukprot:CAMPEP_0181504656 /NCGR_PEP_ID=MMETSP1110-20121109/57630_1 /TAXON_ID=174948 /ORGANISM="Symbiodinium sp., Strain CCMP421" /LENGTH=31 /DNA_ID= /DNA_START= /DNA_END= /DNA_ORIENTATION=